MYLFASLVIAAAPLTDAERLFEEGRAAFRAGDFDVACAKFEASQKQVPALGTLLNWAACLEGQGRLASAFTRFNEAEAWATRTAERRRADFAVERANKLRPRLSYVVLQLEPFREGGVATVAGRAVPLLSAQTAVPVDPGSVEVSAVVPGLPPFASTERAPPEGQRLSVALSTPPPLPAKTVEVVPAAPPAAFVRAPSQAPLHVPVSVTSSSPVAGPVAGLVSSAAVMIAAIIGVVWSLDVAERLKTQQVLGPLVVTREQYQTAQVLHPVSWVAMGLGFVGVVSSSVAWRHALKPRVAVQLAPTSVDVSLAWSLP